MRHGRRFMEIFIVVFGLGVLCVFLYPVFFVKAREKANTSCANNQKVIVCMAMEYAQDHQERLPTASTFWQKLQVAPWHLICPRKPEAANGYGFNIHLGGLANAYEACDDPATVPVTADSDNPRHVLVMNTDLVRRERGGCIASFLDGHIEECSPDTVRLQPKVQKAGKR